MEAAIESVTILKRASYNLIETDKSINIGRIFEIEF